MAFSGFGALGLLLLVGVTTTDALWRMGTAAIDAGQIRTQAAYTLEGAGALAPCKAACFGDGHFFTGRFGSRLFLLASGIRHALAEGWCFIRLTEEQREDVAEILELPPVLRLSDDHGSTGHSSSAACACPYSSVACASMEAVGPIFGNIPLRVLHRDIATFLRPHKRDCPTALTEADDDDTLVMHLRSGDVWQKWIDAFKMTDHIQPPCAYYTDIFDHGNNGRSFRRGIVVHSNATDSAERIDNPCLEVLLSRYAGRLRVQSGSLRADACALMSARHLALSNSVFPASLAILGGVQLQQLFVPNMSGVMNEWRAGWAESPMPWAQHVYSFPDFHPRSVVKTEDWVAYAGPLSRKRIAPK